ncbi:MAG: hypothetical protein HOK71_13655 [Planctomycetaceae bacterium]|nr:hypothetical protein [Planctomycetaceae bacterium]MBT6485691.1 hypothetical protein [Planctomycetaceae bacterium]
MAFTLTVLCFFGDATSVARGDGPWTMATGTKDGYYYELGESVRGKIGPRLHNLATEGSKDNLDALVAKRADFALVQQDVVSRYLTRLGKEQSQSSIEVIGRVSFDYLHIFVRNPLHVNEVQDLRGMRIWLGKPGSGSRVTSLQFLDAIGLPDSQYDGLPTETINGVGQPSNSEATASQLAEFTLGGQSSPFQSRNLDVAMLVATPGMRRDVVRELERNTASLVPLDYRVLRLLTQERGTSDFHQQTFTSIIPIGTYPNQDEPVPTIVVPVLLVRRKGIPDEISQHVWRTTQEQVQLLMQERRQSGQSVPQPATYRLLKESRLPLVSWSPHHKENGQSSTMRWLFFLALVGLLAACYMRYRNHSELRRFRERLRSRQVEVLACAAMLAILFISYATYWVENEVNENFSSPAESFWSITVYLFSGLEDRVPYTTQGRVLAAVGLILGPVFFATLTAVLAATFVNRGKKMPHKLNDHFLVLNWNERAFEVVNQIHHPLTAAADRNSVVVVLTNDIDVNLKAMQEGGDQNRSLFDDVFVSIGDPTDEMALRNAQSQNARSVLVLADDRLEHGADERTIRSVFMLRKIARDNNVNDLHVVAELKNYSNAPILEEMAVEFPGLLEATTAGETRTQLLAQATLHPGLIGFYHDLLSVTDETNEVYVKAIPDAAAGVQFHAYAGKIMAHTPDVPIIPVGVQRKVNGRTKIFCNPRPTDEAFVLQKGDRLVVLSYFEPDDGEFPPP